MALADNIRQGSFRGAAFLWQDSATDLGRRIVKHEYPKRDRPYGEDMGRRAREFTLDVFVQGESWQADRDKLINAIEAPGSGPLVHPNFGEMTVVVTGCRVTERAEAVGRADFQISFLEAGDITFAASTVPATGSQVMAAAADANAAAASAFSNSFTVSGQPSWLQTASIGDIGAALSSVSAAASGAAGAVQSAVAPIQDLVTGSGGTLTTLEQSIAQIEGAAFNLISTPEQLAGQIQGAVGQLSLLGAMGADQWSDVFGGTVSAPADAVGPALAAQLSIATLQPGDSVIPPAPAIARDNPDRQQQAANTAALYGLVRVAALAEAAQAAVAYPYDSSTAAAAQRDSLADLIDGEMLAQSDDDLIDALQALRLALVRELNTLAAKLPALTTFTPATTLPAVVIAHRLYDDPSWAEDIIARNGIRHPLFVPGGVALEVLGNG